MHYRLLLTTALLTLGCGGAGAQIFQSVDFDQVADGLFEWITGEELEDLPQTVDAPEPDAPDCWDSLEAELGTLQNILAAEAPTMGQVQLWCLSALDCDGADATDAHTQLTEQLFTWAEPASTDDLIPTEHVVELQALVENALTAIVAVVEPDMSEHLAELAEWLHPTDDAVEGPAGMATAAPGETGWYSIKFDLISLTEILEAELVRMADLSAWAEEFRSRSAYTEASVVELVALIDGLVGSALQERGRYLADGTRVDMLAAITELYEALK